MKIVSIVGARPQFIKAAALSRALARDANMQEIMIHTGQHYDANMSKVFFDELELPRPAYDLGIGSGSHGAQTGRMLEAIEGVLLRENPDWVLVFGDTNTTLAGALAAAKLHIPLAHVEAGLRSFNRRMPEELNRVLTDHASDLLLSPTQRGCDNLREEGLPGSRIRHVGDLMYDASLYYAGRATTTPWIREHESKGYALATIHRAENTDDRTRLTAILGALNELAKGLPVVLPLHPRTRAALSGIAIDSYGSIQIIEPVGYLEMLALEQHARLVVTDSGGVQKEAYFFGVPSVTLREETEWQELIDTGWSRLAPPTSQQAVCHVFQEALDGPKGRDEALYGHGNAGDKIADALRSVHAARSQG